jgi:predicted RNA-binding Zn-ribbon protein involved in translation (DUF1610 family)
MTNLNSLTVVELKQRLREQGLAVSGNKSELISRLEEQEEQEEDFLVLDEEDTTSALIKARGNKIVIEKLSEKLEIGCPLCGVKLRYPRNYSGNLNCPSCGRSFKPATSETPTKIPIGGILFLSSIGVFLLSLMLAMLLEEPCDGGLGCAYSASAMVLYGGLIISAILFGLSVIYTLATMMMKK